MSSLIADFIAIGPIIFFAFQGFSNGLFWSAYLTVQVLVPLTLALSLFDSLGGLLTAASLAPETAVFVAFALLFFGGWIGLRQLGVSLFPEDGIQTYRFVDKAGGGLVGAFAGVVLGGALLIAWSMSPLNPSLKPEVAKLRFNAGEQLIMRFAKLNESAGDKVLALAGEPYDAEQTKVGAEPFLDRNGNETWEEGEPYVDVNEDEQYTAEFPYADRNGNDERDMGVLEMYRVGKWGIVPQE